MLNDLHIAKGMIMKIFNYIISLSLFIVSVLLVAGGALAIWFAASYPKVAAYFTKKRAFYFPKRESVGFSY